MAGNSWFLDRMALLYDEMVEDPGPTTTTQPATRSEAGTAS